MNKLGIDIGSSTFKYVYLNDNNEVINSNYIFHKGKIKKCFKDLIEGIKENNDDIEIMLGITGSLSDGISLKESYGINNNVALIEGALLKEENVKSIIELGAQETKYITNIDKNNLKFFINTSCAAGTGSFLEEQALRLSIDIKDISSYIEKATSIPRIAGRCSVFSKTDMIHHMQDGVSVEDILQGLCYALVRNYKANVLQKNIIKKPVMFAGGVMNNTGVVKALKDILKLNDDDFLCNKDSELLTCFGACKVAEMKKQIINIKELEDIEDIIVTNNSKSSYKMLNGFGNYDSKDKHICTSENCKEGYLGIDIGSTSTNFVVIDDENQVIDYIYTKTKGRPKEVVIENLEILKERLGKDFKFKGIATTGSGREFIGKLVNADFIVNEITAQAEGAIDVYEDVDTIFEIGGQDSKYISIEDKLIKDFEMNKICAAGTGAFIEEQIKKIGISLEEFGDIALAGDNPCDLGDRCTVFIEGNIGKAIAQNESIENISAGLAYSIVKNYLTRVVGNRKIGEKILLQGGIAHNQAVVNAFRATLNKEIIVPRFFSVTGALGAAVLLKNNINNCGNKNNIVNDSNLNLGNKLFLDGYIAKRDESKKTVGIPRVLFIHKMFPMFNEIFKRLGYNVILSDLTNEEIISLSQEYSFEETCFPVKLINGHVAYLINKKVDYIFLPHLYTMKHAGSKVREDYPCVYMQTSPKIIDSVFNLKEKGVKLIAPELSFNFGKEYMIKTLLNIGEILGKNKIETTAAVMAGMRKFIEYEKKLENAGSDILKDISDDEKVFVIISRVYNITDPVLNMGIEDKLKSMGYKVLHLSHLEASNIEISLDYDNMYWPFGQHLLTAARIIKNNKNLYPVYITNHGCGPDTVISHYIKRELSGKPYLHLEVDEHSSKVGIITRVEAFVNSLNNLKNKDIIKTEENIDVYKKDIKSIEENIIIPYVYPYSDILKAFLERNNKNVTILEAVNENTIQYGKQFSRSKEYFSLIALTAEVINKIKDDNKEYTLYLPTNEGSEVFGQYGNFIRQKALEIGKQLKIEAPFIEDYLGNEEFGLEFYKGIIIGDLLNQLNLEQQEIYLNNLLKTIKTSNIDDEYFKKSVKIISKEISNTSNKKRILVVGELIVVYKDYLNNNNLKRLEKEYKVIKQPLGEILYITFNDFSNKRNKKNKRYKKLLNEVENYLKYTNEVLGEHSPFNKDIYAINETLKNKLDFYAGGSGRYRLGKILTADNIDGMLVISSMYENTSTILKILRDKYKKDINVPIIDLYFDSNINKNTDEIIETFITYL